MTRGEKLKKSRLLNKRIKAGLEECYFCKKPAKHLVYHNINSEDKYPDRIACCEKICKLCSDYVMFDRSNNPERAKIKVEINNKRVKCFNCDELATSTIVLDHKIVPCCSKKIKKCKNFKEYFHNVRLNVYKNFPELIEIQRRVGLEVQNREEVKKSKSDTMKDLYENDKQFIINQKYGFYNLAVPKIGSEKNRKNCSNRFKELYKDKEWVSNLIRSRTMKQNKPEIKLEKMLNEITKDFKYNTGQEFQLMINKVRYRPDFYNEEYKEAILMNGYFHYKKIEDKKTTKENLDTRIINLYKLVGWKLLVIWQDELKSKHELLYKIKEFIKERENVGINT